MFLGNQALFWHPGKNIHGGLIQLFTLKLLLSHGDHIRSGQRCNNRRAIFSVVISVGHERVPAVSADKSIKGLAVDLVQMAVPPVGAAGIRAEL